MIYLKEIIRIKKDVRSGYPFHMDIINQLDALSFSQPVTLFIGENGSGKTTLLESLVSISGIVNLIPDASRKMDGPKLLSKSFKAVWQRKPSRGFYLKAQSFVNFVDNIDKMKTETAMELDELKAKFNGRSDYALSLAAGPYNKTLAALTNRYGKGLDKMSHGEGYLELFKSRLVPKGLYILDEPELSLSPMRQLSLISLIYEMIKQECQFIIITHSPILMALENSKIYDFDDCIQPILYDDIEHVKLTRDFLNAPSRFLRHL